MVVHCSLLSLHRLIPPINSPHPQTIEDFIGTVGAAFAGAVGPQLQEGAKAASDEVG